jgi:hypothetical protein
MFRSSLPSDRAGRLERWFIPFTILKTHGPGLPTRGPQPTGCRCLHKLSDDLQ